MTFYSRPPLSPSIGGQLVAGTSSALSLAVLLPATDWFLKTVQCRFKLIPFLKPYVGVALRRLAAYKALNLLGHT